MTAETDKSVPSSLQQDKLTLSKSSVSTSAADAKLASEREAKDTSDQLAALNQNLKDLEALAQNRSASNNTIASTTPSTAASTPAPASAVSQTGSSLQDLSENKQVWAWAAGLLAAILLVAFWMRRKSAEPESIYAPSYEDIPTPDTEPVLQATPSPVNVPPQMSSIDLNLQPSNPSPLVSAPSDVVPAQVTPPAATSSADETELSKLNLAAQLLAKGDKDLARALILSVISLTHGDIKARAIQMLGQIR